MVAKRVFAVLCLAWTAADVVLAWAPQPASSTSRLGPSRAAISPSPMNLRRTQVPGPIPLWLQNAGEAAAARERQASASNMHSMKRAPQLLKLSEKLAGVQVSQCEDGDVTTEPGDAPASSHEAPEPCRHGVRAPLSHTCRHAPGRPARPCAQQK